jgi:hypothetical protein
VGVLAGALLFGVGLAVIGYRPGTGLAAAGEGSRDAMVRFLGMPTGAAVFTVGFKLLGAAYYGIGRFGSAHYRPAYWRQSRLLFALAIVVLGLLERKKRRPSGPARSQKHWPRMHWRLRRKSSAG